MQRQKFIVDAMLGKLAHWLRLLGYDTIYSRNAEDWWLLRVAKNDQRILITRDRGLYRRAIKQNIKAYLSDPDEELTATLANLAKLFGIDLNVDISMTRCTVCNGVLEKIGENKWRCTRCGKEYWKGSHWRSITETLIKAQSLLNNEYNGRGGRTTTENIRTHKGRRENISRNSETSN